MVMKIDRSAHPGPGEWPSPPAEARAGRRPGTNGLMSWKVTVCHRCGGGEMSRGTHPCVCACIEYLWKVWFPAGGDFVPRFGSVCRHF